MKYIFRFIHFIILCIALWILQPLFWGIVYLVHALWHFSLIPPEDIGSLTRRDFLEYDITCEYEADRKGYREFYKNPIDFLSDKKSKEPYNALAKLKALESKLKDLP